MFVSGAKQNSIPDRHAITLGPDSRDQAAHAMGRHRVREDVDMQPPFVLFGREIPDRAPTAAVHVAAGVVVVAVVVIIIIVIDEVLGVIISSKGVRQRERRLPTFRHADDTHGFLPPGRHQRPLLERRHDRHGGGTGTGTGTGTAYGRRHAGQLRFSVDGLDEPGYG
jgi:hypothetical protein